MATTTSSTPPVPHDPGILATTSALGYVPLTGEAAEQAVRRAAQGNVPWGALTTLKILLPVESRELIISGFGSEMIEQLVERLMRERRGIAP